MTTPQFVIGAAALAGALYAGLSAAFARLLPPAAQSGIPYGVGVCLAVCLASYFLLTWAGRRADKAFFTAFAAGMLGRFVVITAAIAVLFRIPSIDFHGAIYSILASFFPLMAFEVWAVVRRLDLMPGSRPRAPRGSPALLAAILVTGLSLAAGAARADVAGHASEPAHAEEPGHAAPAHDEAAHGEETAHGEAAHGETAHGEAGEHGEGGDVFSHLFHHLNDEVVIPIPPIPIGSSALDISITQLVVMIWIVVALNILIFGALAAKSRSPLPKGRFHNFFESLVVFVKKDMVEDIMGHHLGPKFTPYFLTLFFFILFANLLGLVPFMHTATGNIAVTASLAVLTLLMMQLAGIREQGLLPYVKSIVPGGIPLWLYPIMVPVEILGQFTKPFALTIRLFANMTAGHVVILSLFGLLFLFKNIVLAPAVIGFVLFVSALELLVCFLQAYIFTFLSILFVNACAHPEH